jgi:hypothetical protein
MPQRLSKAEWQARQDTIRAAGGFKAFNAKSSLSAQIDKSLRANAPPPPKAGHNSRKSKPLVADTDGSTCFDDLRYSKGVVYATFTDGSQYTYDDLSRSEARDFFDADSLGGYFNAFIREPTKGK